MEMTHYGEELTVERMAGIGYRWEGHYCGLCPSLHPHSYECDGIRKRVFGKELGS